MTRERSLRISKLLSLALRHRPSALGLTLDASGWTGVKDVLAGLESRGLPIDRETLEELLRSDEKRRLSLTPDGERIRANQGHSVDVDLGLVARVPPELLFHGTVERFIAPIRDRGLVRGARTQVHLSRDEQTAEIVARRRGEAIAILRVRARALHEAGRALFLSDNGVWLTEHVPPAFLELP